MMLLRLVSKNVLIRIGGRILLYLSIAATPALTFGLLTQTAVASTLSDYHKRIDAARGYTDEILKYIDESNPAFERQKITAIRTAVPATEKIELPGGELETDNGWLGTTLDEIDAESDRSKRGPILTGIGERLLAISEMLGDLERAVAATRAKDEDKQKLAEILQREEYQKPQIKEESLFQRWLGEFMEWLARAFPKPQISPETTTGLGSVKFGLQILVYALVIGLVGFLIYKFAPFFFRRLGSHPKKEKKDRVILGERIGRDESAADLFSEAEALAREGNLRDAIRKGYIALLCELSDRKVIGLARHKTNRDYLRDVRKNQPLFENMTGLTGSFERNWYGLGQSEMRDWEDFRDRYRQTIGEVRS